MSGDSTVDLLMGLARSVRHGFVEALSAYDVTPGQARALRALGDDPTRLSELADRLRIAPRSATEVVDALEQRGLVRREPDPTDRRATRVVPTEESRRLREAMGEARRRAAEDLLAELEPGDRAELDRILRLLADP